MWSNTIYSSSETSGVSYIIHRSWRLRWIMICFQRGRSPSWKHACWRVTTPATVLSCGDLVIRKQWHVTSHVFEVAWKLAVCLVLNPSQRFDFGSYSKNNIIFTANCENNSKNCEDNIIFPCENKIIFTCENNSKKGEVIRQKTQNKTFYLTGITQSRGN